MNFLCIARVDSFGDESQASKLLERGGHGTYRLKLKMLAMPPRTVMAATTRLTMRLQDKVSDDTGDKDRQGTPYVLCDKLTRYRRAPS